MAVADYDFHLFDLDGTLVDAEWSYTRGVFDRVSDRLGRPFSDREAYVLWHGLGGARGDTLRDLGIDPDAFWPAFHAEEDPDARAEATYLLRRRSPTARPRRRHRRPDRARHPLPAVPRRARARPT